MLYDKLRITALDSRLHANTCNYWYTVTNGGTAHTAFRTKASAVAWLNALGLTIDGELPTGATYASFEIKGEYRRERFMGTAEAFSDIDGIPVPCLENGDFRQGKLDDKNGIRVLYSVNANCKWAEIYDHRTCSRMKDEGLTVL
jgi:hypothetical protein